MENLKQTLNMCLKVAFGLLLIFMSVGCSPACQNGGIPDGSKCDCPFNTFEASCEERGPSGMIVEEFILLKQPFLIRGLGTRVNESYKFIFEIRHRNNSIVEEVTLQTNNDAPFQVRFSPNELYLQEEGRWGSLDTYLEKYGFQFTIRAEYQHTTGSYRGNVINEPINLSEMYDPIRNSFKFKKQYEVDDSPIPLEFEIKGKWLFD